MLYEYNGGIFIKPLVNKIVEVIISKKGDEYDIKPTKKFMYLTPDIQKQMVQITIEEADKKYGKSSKNSLDL